MLVQCGSHGRPSNKHVADMSTSTWLTYAEGTPTLNEPSLAQCGWCCECCIVFWWALDCVQARAQIHAEHHSDAAGRLTVL